ncbi:choice-of-anchor L domain-containing protein [Aliiglaciecola sp. 3_MG-2023]|uniref:choice-of-anchor L domain-containing protein n=1 Tax=Aliiglaciecola sp. 3_MG-2023 TaxID=3062644 RepID=UPI0026E2329D|nr:choice-of-anchor L domain-containing protein [Aliiglaciecola sp. 3_MG-2023]MDO6692612.1 choice-of-anchor L domain-containing protein [Aliiglaciecola sp. 3_MG-2023]
MKLRKLCLSLLIVSSFSANAGLLGLDLIETGDDPIADITDSLVVSGGGVSVISGTETFVGAIGDGIDSDTAQSGIFSGVNITDGASTVSMGQGAVLTSGSANIPDTNTATAFAPFFPGTGSDADLSAILVDAGAPSSETNDVNYIEFDFTLGAGFNAISLDFIFGSDEFPDQGVTDVFGVFVDGVNYAFFPDSSLVSFVQGANASNFLDNSGGLFDIEYDGFSQNLNLIGLVDETLTEHTLKIAIADTSDTIFDSGVFLSNLTGIYTDNDGGVNNPPSTDVDEPLGAILFLSGLGLMMRLRRRN